VDWREPKKRCILLKQASDDECSFSGKKLFSELYDSLTIEGENKSKRIYLEKNELDVCYYEVKLQKREIELKEREIKCLEIMLDMSKGSECKNDNSEVYDGNQSSTNVNVMEQSSWVIFLEACTKDVESKYLSDSAIYVELACCSNCDSSDFKNKDK